MQNCFPFSGCTFSIYPTKPTECLLVSMCYVKFEGCRRDVVSPMQSSNDQKSREQLSTRNKYKVDFHGCNDCYKGKKTKRFLRDSISHGPLRNCALQREVAHGIMLWSERETPGMLLLLLWPFRNKYWDWSQSWIISFFPLNMWRHWRAFQKDLALPTNRFYVELDLRLDSAALEANAKCFLHVMVVFSIIHYLSARGGKRRQQDPLV